MKVLRKSIHLEAGSVEEKSENGVKYGTFEGYASVFNNLDDHKDIIEAGAFSKTLGIKNQFPLYWRHNADVVVGRITEAYEDSKGLYVKGRLNLETNMGRETYALMKGGDVNAMSIGYRVTDKEWKDDVRIIKSVDLMEISLVPDPANALAQVTSVKCFEALKEAEGLGDVERVLRDSGMTESESKAVISRVKELSAAHDGSDNADGSRDADTQESDIIQSEEWKSVHEMLTKLTENFEKG